MRSDYGVAFVTGGASGLGREAALALARAGAHVVVADRNEAGAEATVSDIVESGGEAISVRLDVTDPTSIESAFLEAEAWKPTIDILVNSAGILDIAPLIEFKLENWNRVMAINVTGTFLCSQRAAKRMVQQRYGRIVNLSSISAVRAGAGRVAYGTSKAAIAGLTRQLALELGPYGITTNSVAPGPIGTPMTESAYTEETVRLLLQMIPTGCLGEPGDIASAVVYLASPQARYVNGAFLAVDGGYLASGVTRSGSVVLPGAGQA